MSESFFEAKQIAKSFRYAGGRLEILKSVDLQIRSGEILALVGPSGAGKTTLLQILGLLDHPDSGELVWRGTNLLGLSARAKARIRNKDFAFVFQFYHLLHEMSALENVMLPAMIGTGVIAWPSVKMKARQKAEKLLEEVGLKDRMYHRPAKLSGGERQRLAVARALLNEPAVVFCDEPTGNLDVHTAREVQTLLWRLNEAYGTSFVIVTHDLSIARKAHRIVAMQGDGLVKEVGRDEWSRIAQTLPDPR